MSKQKMGHMFSDLAIKKHLFLYQVLKMITSEKMYIISSLMYYKTVMKIDHQFYHKH